MVDVESLSLVLDDASVDLRNNLTYSNSVWTGTWTKTYPRPIILVDINNETKIYGRSELFIIRGSWYNTDIGYGSPCYNMKQSSATTFTNINDDVTASFSVDWKTITVRYSYVTVSGRPAVFIVY